MTQATVCILLTIILYIGLMLAIGFYFARRTRSTSDFFLGGRKLGPFVTAMSAEASDMSSYLLMGLPGLAYLAGIADVGWTIIGLGAGTIAAWALVARRLRRYTHITNSITIPEFFSNRYKDDKHILSTIASLVIIVFFVPYTASGFVGCGKLFSSLFGMSYMTATIVSAIVIVAYTVAGGFLAASTTDFIQSIIMTIAILAVLVFATLSAGGVGNVIENARAIPGYFTMTQTHVEATGSAAPYNALTILATLSWGLGYFGMPHFLLRFMAIEDENKLKLSRKVACIWVIVSMILVVFIGLVGRTMTNLGLIPLLKGADSETIIVAISSLMAQHGIIPAVIAGLVVSGILASTMSTADSQLLAASSSVSEDLLRGTFKIKISAKQNIVIARFTVIIIAFLALFLARDPSSSVFSIVSFAWAGFGAAFGPVILCALFWKRANATGAIAGMISGGAMVFIWKFLLKPMGGIWGIYELLPAFIVGAVVIIVVSLATSEPPKEIEGEFDLAASHEALS